MSTIHNKKSTEDLSGKIARLSIDLMAADYKRLKTVASLMGMTMKDLVVISVGDFMKHQLNHVAKAPAKKTKAKPRKK